MKAILILDEMPRECGDCPCIHDDMWRCQADKQFREGAFGKRPSWCPLKTMPNAITERGKWISEEYQKGWNAYREAMGETE